MANSVVLDWLYENELRAFPLQEGPTPVSGGYTLTHDVIVDAQFVASDASFDDCFLTGITVSGTTVTFETTYGNFVANNSLPFPQYIRLSGGHLLVAGKGTAKIPAGSYTFSVKFEPATVYEYDTPWLGVTSVQFGTNSPLTGAINLIEGYQFKVNISDQTITLGANNLYGLPISCDHFGDRDNDCDEIISFINGIRPDGNNELKIIAGDGINVLDDPQNHRIYIGFSFTSVNDICSLIPPFPV